MSLILSELRRALEKITGSQATTPNGAGETVRVTGYTPSGSMSHTDTMSSINSLAAKIAGQLAKLYENPDVTGFENLLQWLEGLKARNQYEYSLLVKTVDRIVSSQPYGRVWRVLLSTGDPHQAYRYTVELRDKMRRNMVVNRLRKYLSPQEIKMVVNSKGEVDPEKLADLIRKRIESMLHSGKGMMSEKNMAESLEEIKKLIHVGVSLAGNREEAWKTIISKVSGRGADAGKLQLIMKHVANGDVKTAIRIISGHNTAYMSSIKNSMQELRSIVHKNSNKDISSKNSFHKHMAERIANMAKNMEKPPVMQKLRPQTG